MSADEKSAEDRRSVIKGTRVTALSNILGAATTILTWAVVRLYGDAIWGQFVLAESLAIMATYVGSLGLHRGMLFSISRSRLDESGEVEHPFRTVGLPGAIVLTLLSGAAIAALGIGLSGYVVGEVFAEPDALLATRITLAATPFAAGLFVVSFALVGMRYLGTDAILRGLIVPNLMRLVPVLLAFLDLGSELLAASYFLAQFLGFWVSLFILRGIVRSRALVNEGFAWPSAKVLRYSLAAGAADFGGSLLVRIDVWMIAAYLTDSEVGIYGVLISLVVTLRHVRHAIDRPLVPVMGEATARRDGPRVRALMSHAAFMVGSLAGPILVAILLGGRELVGLYGDQFVQGADAMIILAAGNLVFAVFGLATNVISGAGRGRYLLFNSVLALGLNITLNSALIPRFGLSGAAGATALTLGTVAMVEYAMARYTMRSALLQLSAFEPLAVAAGAAALASPVYFALVDDPANTRIPRFAMLVTFFVLYAPWFWKRSLPAFRLPPRQVSPE